MKKPKFVHNETNDNEETHTVTINEVHDAVRKAVVKFSDFISKMPNDVPIGSLMVAEYLDKDASGKISVSRQRHVQGNPALISKALLDFAKAKDDHEKIILTTALMILSENDATLTAFLHMLKIAIGLKNDKDIDLKRIKDLFDME